MALIQSGTIKDFALSEIERPDEEGMMPNFSLSTSVQEGVTETYFVESRDTRGLTLSELSMLEGYPNILKRWFNNDTELYFLSWTWDMAGLHLYPGEISTPESCLIRLNDEKNVRRFIGQGVALFEPRTVRSGLAVRIQVWESKEDLREFGKLMKRVAEIADQSALKQIITAAAVAATGGAAGTILLAQEAAAELTKAIGGVLSETSDKLVDYFEGYYSAAEPWPVGAVRYEGDGSSIELNHIK